MSNRLTKPTDVECKGDLKAFERNRYFYGKLLTVRDFETEQRYFIDKHRLINRLIHGSGVACGLMVSMKSGSNTTVTIESGVALDCCGREIVVPVAQDIDLSKENIFTTQPAAYIVLKYDWCGKEKVPNVSDVSSCEETCCYSRIMESYMIEVVKDKPEECIVFDEKFCGNMENFIKNPDDAEARKKLLDAWQKCAAIGSDPAVNLAYVEKEGSSFTIDNTARTLLYNNPVLYEIMKCHMADLENPHNVTAEQVKALKSINNVGNVETDPPIIKKLYISNIDLISSGKSIDITPDPKKNNKEINIDLADRAVTNPKIADNAVTSSKIAESIFISSDNSILIKKVNSAFNLTTAGGGAECITGAFVFKNIPAGATKNSTPVELPDRVFGVILGVQYESPMPPAPPTKIKFIITGDEIRDKGIGLSSNLDLVKNNLVVTVSNRSKETIEELNVRWWAIMPTKDMGKIEVPTETKIGSDDLIKDIAINPNITFKSITTKYNITDAEVEEAITPLIESGVIKVTGTGVNRKLMINV